jgi:hypothetical protein
MKVLFYCRLRLSLFEISIAIIDFKSDKRLKNTYIFQFFIVQD